MKGILDFGLNILLWFFYYHTTLNTFSDSNNLIINYHNFAVNTVIYVSPYIFTGICMLWESEKKADKFILGYIGTVYVIICLSFFSGLSLEFILQNRTVDDLKIGIPGLILFTTVLPIEIYGKCLLIFPILNYIMPAALKILSIEKEEK